VLAKLREDEE